MSIRVTPVDGFSQWRGAYALDGSLNVTTTSGVTPVGLYAKDGSMNVTVIPKNDGITRPLYARDGSMNVTLDPTYISGPRLIEPASASYVVGPLIDTNYVHSAVAVTRAGDTATYFDNTGTLQTALANTPRLDYNPSTSTWRGLLVEPAATNTLFGNEFANAAVWGAINLNQTGTPPWVDVAVAPTGAQVAEALIENTATGEHRISATAAATLNSSQSMSLFVKALPSGSSRNVRLLFGNNASIVNNVSCVFTNNAGVFAAGSAVNSGTATNAAATCTDIGSGWYLLTLSGIADPAVGAGTVNVRINILPAGTASYTGDNASGVYIWSPQLEAAAGSTSSIVPGSSAITRNADVALISGADFSSIWNATENTIYCEFEVKSVTAAANRFVFEASLDTNNRASVAIDTAGAAVLNVYLGGPLVVSLALGAVSLGLNKVAAALKADNVQGALNGVVSAADTNTGGSLPAVNKLNIGTRFLNDFPLNGWIKKLRVIPKRCTNTELGLMTS